jgi:hypothetical protein
MEEKERKRRRMLLKHAASERRKDISNINQKASIFDDKRMKRKKTRKAQLDHFLNGDME